MKTKEDRLPPWVSLIIAVAIIFGLSAIFVHYFMHQEPVFQPIGQYNGLKMSEPLDQDMSKGIAPSVANG